MATPNVSQAMRDFMSRHGDRPIENSKFQHDGSGNLLLEECRGFLATYIKTCADGDWAEARIPFEEAQG